MDISLLLCKYLHKILNFASLPMKPKIFTISHPLQKNIYQPLHRISESKVARMNSY